MAQQTINTTDTLNAGRAKINSNFTELYNSISTKTDDYTILLTDKTIVCDTSSRDIDITLPDATTNTARVYVIKHYKQSSGSYVLTVLSADTIDGDASLTIPKGSSITVQSTGTNYVII